MGQKQRYSQTTSLKGSQRNRLQPPDPAHFDCQSQIISLTFERPDCVETTFFETLKIMTFPFCRTAVFGRAALISLAFALSGRGGLAQVVTFPDPALENAVRSALGILAPTNIYRTNLSSATFTNFSANGLGIQNLSGLEYATNLTFLQIHGNFTRPGLTNIVAVTQLRKLTNLDIPYNQLTNGSPIAGLTNLAYLDIGWNRDSSDNSITDLSFLTNLLRLRWLSLFYLRVSDVTPIAGLNLMTNLNVSYNYVLTNVSAFNALSNTAEFYATSTSLRDIAFASHMPLLKKLDFGNNNVTNLSSALGHSLVALWDYNNPLINAELATNLTSLTLLHTDNNGLTNAAGLARLTALTELSMDYNLGLVNLSFVSALTNLTYLSAGGLPLSSLSVLASLTNLHELHLHDDTNLASIAPLLGLPNLNNLDLDDCPKVNFATLTNLPAMAWLHVASDGLQSVSFIAALTNLNGLWLDNNRLTSLDPLAALHVGELHVSNNRLGDINVVEPMTNSLYYLDLRNNYLDVSPGTVAWTVITNLQDRYAGQNYTAVDYLPQLRSSSVTIFVQPADQCVAVGANPYFAISATTSAGSLQVQWQFNHVDITNETNATLVLSGVSSNQAGLYQAVLQDDNGGLLTDPARLYVGDTNCGRTIFIQQQPLNTCAAPGEDVIFTIAATTTLTNLYYQWQFNGTNITAATGSELDLFGVTSNAAGFYQVMLWDDSSNVVLSAKAQLKVVDLVTFTDSHLSNQVALALFQQSGLPVGSPIYLTNLDSLTYLYVNNSGITDVAGLECARNLNSLDLSGNLLTNTDRLGWDYQLGNLNLDNCGLQDASFVSTLTNLYSLSLNNNQIHSVPRMDGFVYLAYLYINGNGCLINFPRLTGLTNLLNLSLHSDCLFDISFVTNMNQLQSLDVGADWMDDPNRSYVHDLAPLTGKTNLNWLSLSWDQATNVSVLAPFTNMLRLYLSGNPFKNLSFISNMSGLVELTINYSQVTNIGPVASRTPLQSLDIGYIATSNLTAVSGLTNLNYLYAGGNNAGSASMLSAIRHLYNLGFEMNAVSDSSPLAGMTNLGWLQFENNRLTNITVLSGKTTLQNLYLTGNQIHDLTPLSGLTNVNSLSLSGNGFTNVAPLANLRALTWLVMQSNHIQDISSLSGLTNLSSTLDISANEITNLSPVTNLHALTSLQPWLNRLTSLPSLVGLSNVTSLDFWGNQLTNVAGVCGMTQLNWLGLTRNNLTSIQPLSGLPNLQTLDLWGNQLTNASGISGLPLLGWLGLSRNNFSAIQSLTNLPSLRTIELYTNHLTDVSGLASLTGLNWLYLEDNNLQDIHSLTNLTALNYVDLTYNLLDTNVTSVAMANIAVMQSHSTYVNYIPQKTASVNAPTLLGPTWLGGNQFRFTVQGLPGTVLRIWTSTNLVNWTPGSFLTNTSGTVIFTDPAAGGPQRFYRVQTQ